MSSPHTVGLEHYKMVKCQDILFAVRKSLGSGFDKTAGPFEKRDSINSANVTEVKKT